ncbi:zinc finger and SCAN domain-containing protein 21 [Drosophila biarmipes]|uniref:zinc finger and SCAN domain-containing protein 21 n=1 Tax=Drosophila biarmipes TaxID=125945 RepID=UPI0007E69C9A|nr:zinc finger and SCAN domain-containing protein 21 [Drosophila biarmipes]
MANNLEPRVVDLGVACLVCLAEEPESSSIYGHDPESPHMLILDKIRCCTGLQLDGNPAELPTWPDKICRQCLLELSVSYRFHEKCAAVQKLYHSAVASSSSAAAATVSAPLLLDQQQEQLKIDLVQAQLRLPATLKIKRLDMDPSSSSSVSSAITTATEPSFYQDVVEEDEEADALSLMPEGAMVLSLNDLQERDPIKEQPEDEDSDEQQQQEEDEEESKMLGLDPWDDDNTPEHLYEIETSLMEESVADSPPLPPPQPSSQQKKRAYRRVSPVAKRDGRNGLPEADLDEDYKPASTTKRRHERSPKICDVCGNTYKYQHALNAHMRRHNNERPYPCEVCQKAFISNVELRRHMRVHTGQKPYSCGYCDRRFSDFGSSKKHERIHTGERPYVCEVCHKGFAYAHVLSVHRRTHTGKKQFQCTQCDKGFTKKSYLSAHMDQHRGSGGGETSGSSASTEGPGRSLRLPARKENARREPVRKPIPEAFSLDSVVLEQTKVLEECIVANDFMFNEEDNAEEEDGDQDAELQHDEPYPEPDFGDVDGYQSVRSVKELVGDLLDTEEFVDESKYMID